MATHEFTAADLSWAKFHFSDSWEAQAALKDFQSERLELQRHRRDAFDLSDQQRGRIDARIAELQEMEAELADLLIDVAMADLFDLI